MASAEDSIRALNGGVEIHQCGCEKTLSLEEFTEQYNHNSRFLLCYSDIAVAMLGADNTGQLCN